MFQAFRLKPHANRELVRQALENSRGTLGSPKELAIVYTDDRRYVIAGKGATRLENPTAVSVGDGSSYGYQGKVTGIVVERITAPFINWKIQAGAVATLASFLGTMACMLSDNWLAGGLALSAFAVNAIATCGFIGEKMGETDNAHAFLESVGVNLSPVERNKHGELIYATDTGNVPI